MGPTDLKWLKYSQETTRHQLLKARDAFYWSEVMFTCVRVSVGAFFWKELPRE